MFSFLLMKTSLKPLEAFVGVQFGEFDVFSTTKMHVCSIAINKENRYFKLVVLKEQMVVR